MNQNLRFNPKDRTAEPPLRVIHEQTEVAMAFNIMPDRPVRETLFIREYRIWNQYIEATFDRSYSSSMERSPSHLIFATALAHTQKMLYVYACHHFDAPYDPRGPERFKIWPTKVDVRMPKMVRQESDIVHCLHVASIKQLGENTFKFRVKSKINNVLTIDGDVPIFRT